MQEISPTPNRTKEKIDKSIHLVFLIIQFVIFTVVAILLLQIGEYGWTLFLIIPFSIGISIGTYTVTYKTKKLLRGSGITMLFLFVISGLLIALGIEGAICIIMALGIIFLPALAGTALGLFIRNLHRVYIIAFLFIINTSAYVYDTNNDNGIHSIASQNIIINTSASAVWEVLMNPVKFTRSSNFLFKSGLSYPQDMYIIREQTGDCFLVCNYKNGFTQLRIEKLDSLKSLRFLIEEVVIPMKELSVHHTVDAPHLQGYFKPEYGEFILTELDENKIMLTAQTAYTYKITPEFYWQWWTDYLTNTMHQQVLNDIKFLSESKQESQ